MPRTKKPTPVLSPMEQNWNNMIQRMDQFRTDIEQYIMQHHSELAKHYINNKRQQLGGKYVYIVNVPMCQGYNYINTVNTNFNKRLVLKLQKNLMYHRKITKHNDLISIFEYILVKYIQQDITHISCYSVVNVVKSVSRLFLKAGVDSLDKIVISMTPSFNISFFILHTPNECKTTYEEFMDMHTFVTSLKYKKADPGNTYTMEALFSMRDKDKYKEDHLYITVREYIDGITRDESLQPFNQMLDPGFSAEESAPDTLDTSHTVDLSSHLETNSSMLTAEHDHNHASALDPINPALNAPTEETEDNLEGDLDHVFDNLCLQEGQVVRSLDVGH